MKNPIARFEIRATQRGKVEMCPIAGAVFADDMEMDGAGRTLVMSTTGPSQPTGDALVHLPDSPSLEAALERGLSEGVRTAHPRQASPTSMVFSTQITDLHGNREALRALV